MQIVDLDRKVERERRFIMPLEWPQDQRETMFFPAMLPWVSNQGPKIPSLGVKSVTELTIGNSRGTCSCSLYILACSDKLPALLWTTLVLIWLLTRPTRVL